MIDSNAWPTNLTYAPCDSVYSNPVERTNLNLRKAFNSVRENRGKT